MAVPRVEVAVGVQFENPAVFHMLGLRRDEIARKSDPAEKWGEQMPRIGTTVK